MPSLPTVSDDDRVRLVSGVYLFDEVVPAAPSIDALQTNTAMHEFLAPIRKEKSTAERLRVLIRRLDEKGFLNFRYEEALTQGAGDTFLSGAGNCLSYTNLFVALARELGLRARYQRVDVPPTWDINNDLLIRSNHINVVVQHIRNTGTGPEFVMDFNYVEPEADYDRWVVRDKHAFALMYANLAVEAMKGNRLREAFAYVKRAIQEDAENADHWVNLGVIYAQAGLSTPAESAFAVALRMTWRRQSAFAGLAGLYRKTGQIEAAERMEASVRRLRERNPFYHLAVGQAAYDAGKYESALASFERAIALRSRTGVFHFMKGLSLFHLGDDKRAQRGLRMAKHYGQVDDFARHYQEDLAGFLEAYSTEEVTTARWASGWDLYRNRGFRTSRIE